MNPSKILMDSALRVRSGQKDSFYSKYDFKQTFALVSSSGTKPKSSNTVTRVSIGVQKPSTGRY